MLSFSLKPIFVSLLIWTEGQQHKVSNENPRSPFSEQIRALISIPGDQSWRSTVAPPTLQTDFDQSEPYKWGLFRSSRWLWDACGHPEASEVIFPLMPGVVFVRLGLISSDEVKLTATETLRLPDWIKVYRRDGDTIQSSPQKNSHLWGKAVVPDRRCFIGRTSVAERIRLRKYRPAKGAAAALHMLARPPSVWAPKGITEKSPCGGGGVLVPAPAARAPGRSHFSELHRCSSDASPPVGFLRWTAGKKIPSGVKLPH